MGPITSIFLSGIPTPTTNHPDERGIVGKPFTLVCHNSAKQSVTWWRRSSPDAEEEFISYSDGVLLNGFEERCRMEGDNLVFHKLEFNDTATYYCVEEAGQGIRHVTQLTVLGNQRTVLLE